jgi:hypothetical protein
MFIKQKSESREVPFRMNAIAASEYTCVCVVVYVHYCQPSRTTWHGASGSNEFTTHFLVCPQPHTHGIDQVRVPARPAATPPQRKQQASMTTPSLKTLLR